MPEPKPSLVGRLLFGNLCLSPLPWRVPALPVGSWAITARAFIPLKGARTKQLCARAWILPGGCGYRATKPPRKLLSATSPGEDHLISEQNTDAAWREQGDAFLPRFDAAGLLTAVAQDAESGRVLMVAFMDAEALEATRRSGFAHFHSRSRGRLWKKGETSGHVLRVEGIEVDCDQDALLLQVRPAGPACHTGATSCFYRRLEGDALARIPE